MFVDTHIHIYSEKYGPERDALIKKAVSNGIGRLYMPNIDLESIGPMLDAERAFPGVCFPMMGLHPTSVAASYRQDLQVIRDWLDKRKFAAVGEIGIDLYWDKTFRKEQEEAFAIQTQWAVELGYPIVIHTRNSFRETVDVLKTLAVLPKGIFHCFSGTAQEADEAIALGFKLGIGGVLTFKNSGLAKAIENIGLEHLVLETDAPYLAPEPFRGKRNEPAYLLEVARKLAMIRDLPVHVVEEMTTANALGLFSPSP